MKYFFVLSLIFLSLTAQAKLTPEILVTTAKNIYYSNSTEPLELLLAKGDNFNQGVGTPGKKWRYPAYTYLIKHIIRFGKSSVAGRAKADALNLRVTKLLNQAGVTDFNSKTAYAPTPEDTYLVALLSEGCQPETLEWFIELGGNLNVSVLVDEKNYNPLTFTAVNYCEQAAKILVDSFFNFFSKEGCLAYGMVNLKVCQEADNTAPIWDYWRYLQSFGDSLNIFCDPNYNPDWDYPNCRAK